MGGSGGGIAYNREEFVEICERGLEASPTRELLIEESLLGWKEFEMEVVRDRADNCIIICSIENLDPMGVHTGDSITVAPAQTLTDKEYQIMRDASIAVLREIGVDTGGSNVQFAVNPRDGRMVVIEMNPRVSRSSALASKATGFPIAKVAAKLAVGYTLDELKNDITGGATPASFEPTIDYVVTKIPRFAFEKFPQANDRLTTQMKSVGEVMAIGRTFQESFQKALRGLEVGVHGLDKKYTDREAIATELGSPGPDRIWAVGDAFRLGMTWTKCSASADRPVVPGADRRSDPPGTGAGRPLAGRAGRRQSAYPETQRFCRCAIGCVAGYRCRCGARLSPCPGRTPGVQARGHLCGRVRHQHRLHVFHLRGGMRSATDQQQEDHGAGRRTEPHRSGHRVRLLLCACRAGDARRRL